MERTLIQCYKLIGEADAALKQSEKDEQILKLQAENDSLRAENIGLKFENESLRSENTGLKVENESLRSEKEKSKEIIGSLKKNIDELTTAAKAIAKSPVVSQGPNSCIVINPGGDECYL